MISSPIFPAQNMKAVSAGDNLESMNIRPKALYVGTAGNLVVRLYNMKDVETIPNAPVGYHPLEVAEIDVTTAASGMVAVW